MLEVNNLSVRYPNQDKYLLKDISFKLNCGETLWVQGENGSGKSTLLYAISNIIPQAITATRIGDIKFNNNLINEIPINKHIPQISIMLSNPQWELFFTYPEDEIVFALENIGLSEPEIKNRVIQICDLFRLNDILEVPSNHLSVGWQKMLVLAIHAAIRPKILILDEPLNGLSDDNTQFVLNWMKEFVSDNRILIIADHKEVFSDLNPAVLKIGI